MSAVRAIKKAIAAICYIITAPFYLVVIVIDVALGPWGAADWAADKLGLQGRGPGATFPTTGSDGLVGAVADVLEDFRSSDRAGMFEGKVRVKGEIWAARASVTSPPLRGSSVHILQQDGLSLVVEPLQGF